MSGPVHPQNTDSQKHDSAETTATTSSDSLDSSAGEEPAPITFSADSNSSLQDLESTADQNSSAANTTTVSPSELSLPDLQPSENGPFITSETPFVHPTPMETPVAGSSAEGGAEQSANTTGLIDHVTVKEEGEVLLEPVNSQIELLEGSSEIGAVPGEAGLIVEESQEWIPDPDHELKRVKVYELMGQRWVDQGTAFCFGQFSEERNEALLIARSERNYNDIVLTTAIRSNDVYQRQQDTLIVWTEPDGVDYALSFQDPEGCAEVWTFILEVQHHLNTSEDQPNASSPILGPDATLTEAGIVTSGHLPSPQMGVISEIERAIKSLSKTQTVKERICEFIQHEDYIKSLVEVMQKAEDLESLENLHALCSLMQTILMLNDHTMYEHILEDDIFFGVVGMLEYDPDFPGHKANYRDFLHNTAQFHQPIPMRDIVIQRKIHHTYRLQFLKDVVLARALDDSTFNVLNSCIIFNQIDIIQHVQQDQTFLRDIVRLFVDEDMLTGGGARRQMQLQQQHQQQLQQQQGQHMVISLNGGGDNARATTPDAMDVDSKGSPTSPKLLNGSQLESPNSSMSSSAPTTPMRVNGNGVITTPTPKPRSTSYAFAPPDNLTEAEINLRREVILLLQQLSIMGKNVQMPARLSLFRTLVDRGILFAVQWALNLSERDEPSSTSNTSNKTLISAAGEVLSAMLDHDLNGVRGHVLKQVVAIEKEREAGKKGADKAETVLEMACRVMAQSRDLSVQSQMGDALKVWLEVPMADGPGAANVGEALGPKPLATRKDEPVTERFMDYLYKDCVKILLKPLAELPEWKNFKEPIYPLTREEANRYVYLCDLLFNFIQQHNFRSHFHVMSSDILPRVATLFRAKDKHLRHVAFRIFRLLLRQNNPNSHIQILKHDIFKPILDLTIKESIRDNLLSCSCQEYFEIMRKENMKELIKFCMVKHEEEIKQLAKSTLGGDRFQLLIRRHEMNVAPPPMDEPSPNKSELDRGWAGPGRALDPEEEDYFNGDEDEPEILPSISQQNWLRVSGTTSPLMANNTALKRKRRTVVGAATKGYRPPLKAPQLSSLVDYDEDDDENQALPESQITPIALSRRSASSPSPEPPSSPNPSTRSPSPTSLLPSTGPPPKRAAKDEDEEDSLEALARNNPQRPGEKRRREDDEDEELLGRLSKASRKPDLGGPKELRSTIPGRPKTGDDPPPAAKKIKVKFGSVGLSMASTSPSTPTSTAIPNSKTNSSSEPGSKDADTG
ncbi:component of IIS longevity pathway SMK-1-domain-containing protein [Crepidotus variabilis]|uniref:Component of IIS longevity pathway SMK-1-domain-containing protein n=1 Tax=Crepidotus variabilis TaxID=179855 RepID=A0A9P6ERV4_9AGAR|nr:component of IIS longevity pathway SMK-1-domain-containing protein [Crepidotus variabilis]